FFCQAEDGIRDDLVTGVQTCALPICASLSFADGDRYVALSLSFDPRDAPHACRVILGEGSLEMPECDWNGIGLWRLVDEPRTNQIGRASCRERLRRSAGSMMRNRRGE